MTRLCGCGCGETPQKQATTYLRGHYKPPGPPQSQPWHDAAACRDHPRPDIFHPDQIPGRRKPGGITAADLPGLAVCAPCPVRTDCLQAALDTDPLHDYGIWGGTVPSPRATLRTRGRTA